MTSRKTAAKETRLLYAFAKIAFITAMIIAYLISLLSSSSSLDHHQRAQEIEFKEFRVRSNFSKFEENLCKTFMGG